MALAHRHGQALHVATAEERLVQNAVQVANLLDLLVFFVERWELFRKWLSRLPGNGHEWNAQPGRRPQGVQKGWGLR